MVASDTASITPEDSTQDQLGSCQHSGLDGTTVPPSNEQDDVQTKSQHPDDSYTDEASDIEQAAELNDAASSMWGNSDGEDTMQQTEIAPTKPASNIQADNLPHEQMMASGDTDTLLASSSEDCTADAGNTYAQSRRASAADNTTAENAPQPMAQHSTASYVSSQHSQGNNRKQFPLDTCTNRVQAEQASRIALSKGHEDSYSQDGDTADGEISFQNDQHQHHKQAQESTWNDTTTSQSCEHTDSRVECPVQQEDAETTRNGDGDCVVNDTPCTYNIGSQAGELNQTQEEAPVIIDNSWDEESELVLRISTQHNDMTPPHTYNCVLRPHSAASGNQLHSLSAGRSCSRPGFATGRPESHCQDATYSPSASAYNGHHDCEQWSEASCNVNTAATNTPHPTTWCARDVADWITSIGMDQYRKRFVHNCVDGRLLLALTDQLLKTELGIGPLGHRVAILQAIQALALMHYNSSPNTLHSFARPLSVCTQRSAFHGSRSRPCSAPRLRGMQGSQPAGLSRPASASPGVIPPESYLGPASGKISVYEQRSKLKYELDRASARAAQQRSIAEQLSRTASLTAEEVARLRGLLSDLEMKNGMLVAGGLSGGIDADGRIPWRPASAQTAISGKACTEAVTCGGCISMPAQPRMTHRSKELLAQTQAQGVACATFLDRLEMDNRRRERARLEADNKYYSPEALHKDPLLARKKQQRDLKFVTDCLKDKGLITVNLVGRDTECDGVLVKDVTDQCKDIWGIPDSELDMIQAAHGVRRVTLLAAALRAQLFMSRYDTEQADRLSGTKQRELQTKYWEPVMGKPKETKAAQDMSQCVKHFAQLGWSTEDDITDDRLSALLRRVAAYKQAHEKWRDQQAAGQAGGGPVVDFSMPPFSSDGLAALQAAAPQTPVTDIKGVPKPGSMDALTYTVQLLAGCRRDDIEKMEALSGSAKQLAVYRHIRTQKFIEFTETEIKSKQEKLNQAYVAMSKPKRVISKPELDGFLDRLMDDAAKRRITREKMAAEKLEKEAANVKSVAMYKTRPRSAR